MADTQHEKQIEQICPYPGKARSEFWKFFGFRKKIEGPLIRENLEMSTVICKLCQKSYVNKASLRKMRRAAVASKVPQSRALKVVKELDAFPKVPDSFKQTTASGGGVSVVTFLVIFILVISEFHYYTRSELKFDYVVDTEVVGTLRINIDMTVAMTCDKIGADVLDQTGQDTHSFGSLTMENTYYELSTRQQHYHDITRQVNQYVREQYHAIQELMWLSGHQPGYKMGMPERDDDKSGPFNGCRIHGSLEVNKVAGNFHVTAGKYFPQLNFGLGHVHLESFLSDNEYNFTHRIDHFSFGDRTGGIISPLDGEEQVTKNNYQLYQYFMKVVPTEVRTYSNQVDTYQFSVTHRNRSIDHKGGSHGVPGIFVKYDLFPFKIRVKEEHRPYSQLLIRLCGIIGGIFVVSGLLHDGVGFLFDIFCCRFKFGKYSANSTASKGESLLVSGDDNAGHVSRGNALDNQTRSYDPVDFLEEMQQGTNLAKPLARQDSETLIIQNMDPSGR